MPKIKCIIFDFDGVFNKDDYSAVIESFHKSSGIDKKTIEEKIGEHERKWVIKPDSEQFLRDLIDEFNFKGSRDDLVDLLNKRGDTGLFKEIHKFKELGLGLSILSNQIAYRVPYAREQLESRFGLEKFQKIYFSPEIGLQKPFVGLSQDRESDMDVSGVDIFPLVVKDMKELGYSPEECVFIDDSKANIRTARKYGFNGIIFENLNQMKKELDDKYSIKID